MLTVVFCSPVQRADIERYELVVEWTPEQASMRISRNNIAESTAAILNSFSIVDLMIEEVPIEDVIREIFSKPGWESEADVA